jgi:hypothetical protein
LLRCLDAVTSMAVSTAVELVGEAHGGSHAAPGRDIYLLGWGSLHEIFGLTPR